jgi:hypothetical protein
MHGGRFGVTIAASASSLFLFQRVTTICLENDEDHARAAQAGDL